MSFSGHCLCGDIQYQFQNPPLMAGVCHCLNCQRQAGSAFSTIVGVSKADFTFTSGTPTCYEDRDTRSGNLVSRYFCGRCGSPLYSALPDQPDMIFVKSGTLNDTSAFQPMFHVWCDTKQNWVELDDTVPQMQTQA